jgi:pyridoxamine 5'-phosphate oxidase
VRVEGDVAPVSAAEADAYFASRARDSQIGAWASDQSRPLAHPGELEERFRRFAEKYAAQPEVPRPENWSGFRVRPDHVEFWQERPFRLHDRVAFTCDGERWRKQRLFP